MIKRIRRFLLAYRWGRRCTIQALSERPGAPLADVKRASRQIFAETYPAELRRRGLA